MRRAGITSPICRPARTWWRRSAWPAGGRVFRRTKGIELAEPPVNPGLYVVTLSTANDLEVLDFGNYRSGEAGYASIAGHVYVDVDNDGICDPQEMGLPNVPITIEGPVTRVGPDRRDGPLPRGRPAGRRVHDRGNPAAGVPGRPGHGRQHPASGTLENDRFVDVELLPDMVAEDYNFGEYGLKVRVHWQAAAAGLHATGQRVRGRSASGTGSVAVVVAGPRRHAAGRGQFGRGTAGDPTVRLPLAAGVAGHAERRLAAVPVTAGEAYLIYVHAARPAVVRAALDTAPAPSRCTCTRTPGPRAT